MTHPNYLLSALALVLLFVPLIISRLGLGTKRWWQHYAFVMSGSFLVAAFEAWRIQLSGGPINLSLVLAVCSFMGGAFAESTAGRMRRF